MIYLDHQSTTPMSPRVFEAMKPFFLEHFGNASSRTHSFGLRAEEAIDQARVHIAKAIGSKASTILFTSGATESNNLVFQGLLSQLKGKRIITLATEHSSVLEPAMALRKHDVEVIVLDVDEDGLVNLDELKALCSDSKTALVSVMWANNEIGVIQPIKKISKIAKETNTLFHCDATQALGKVDVNLTRIHLDFASFSAHKVQGPKGIGALYVKNDRFYKDLQPPYRGGDQERGIRPGTLNVPAIVGFGEAVQLIDNRYTDIANYRDELYRSLKKNFDDQVAINGYYNLQLQKNSGKRLAENLNIYLKGIEAEGLMAHLKNIAISSGSACHAHAMAPSHVIEALVPYDRHRAFNSLRLSISINTLNEISPEDVVADIKQAAHKCKA